MNPVKSPESGRGPREDSESSSAAARASGSLQPKALGVGPQRQEKGGAPRAVGIAGWLLVLCALLLVWQPLNLALAASSVLDSLPIGGLPLALVLLARVLVTAFGIAAGLALLGRRSGAVGMAKISLALSAAVEVFVYSTPFFPNNRAPGETPILAVGALAYYAIWLMYLFRSARVRNTFTTPNGSL